MNFNHHGKEKVAKANKGIGLIRKLAHVLPEQSLLTIYKSFIRPHLDYGDIIYDQPNNESFCNLIEKVQYNAALAITGAIKGTSQLKIYNELGIESLKFRRWFRRLCVFLKLKLPKFQSIYMNLFCLNHIFIALETQKMLKLIIAELINFNTPFFHILQLNGIKLISIYAMPNLS